ncbi:MAG: hypothetical protein H6704_08020 [Myxococcales bacterium]|nr:hypothetical protein [Myxococcales bacterium]
MRRHILLLLLWAGAGVGCLPAFDDQCGRDDDCAQGVCRSGLCVSGAGDAEGARDAAPAPDSDAPADAGPSDDAASMDAAVRWDAAPPVDAEVGRDAQPVEDAGRADDAAVIGDGALEPDAAPDPDAAEVDAAVDPDAAIVPDAASEPDATAVRDAAIDRDAARVPDAAVDPDAAATPDATADPDAAASLDAALEPDAAVALDARPPDDLGPPPDAGEPCEPGQGRSCGPGGACIGGFQFCVDGFWGPCEGSGAPSPETCNASDDDCDGLTDEDVTRPCGSDVGSCEPGVETCTFGEWGPCQGGVDPVFVEVCDGEDQDCDGEVDEAPEGGPLSCPAPHAVGVCELGACGDFRCDEGWLNTDGDRADGCEHGCGPATRGQAAGRIIAPSALAMARSAGHTLVAAIEGGALAEPGPLVITLDGALVAWGDGGEDLVYDDVAVARVGDTFLVAATQRDEVRFRRAGRLTLVRVALAGADGARVETRHDSMSVAGPPSIGMRSRAPAAGPEAVVVLAGAPPGVLGELLPVQRLVAVRVDLDQPLATRAFETIDAPAVGQTELWDRTTVVDGRDGFLVFAEHIGDGSRQVLLEVYGEDPDGWVETGHLSAAGATMLDAPVAARSGDRVLLATRWQRGAQVRLQPYVVGRGFDDARLVDADAGSSPPAVYATDDGFVVLAGGPDQILARFLDLDGVLRTEAAVPALVAPAGGALQGLRLDARDGAPRALWWVDGAADDVQLRTATIPCE